MKKIYLSALEFCAKLSWLPRLLARLTIGIIFIESGWGKLHHLQKVIDFFTSLHIPAPEIQAPMVASLELGCGTLIILGLATRIASLPLIGTMTVAIITARVPDFETWTDLFGAAEFLYIVILIYLITDGAGPISLDYLIGKKQES